MKYYFDTSSLVKVYHPEQGSKETLKLYEGNWEICISELGALEFVSVIYRKYREGEIDSDTIDELFLKFQEDVESRYELLSFSPLVFEEASRLLEIHGKGHSLRTLDSIQFAFFSTYCEKADVFVCSDKRLASVVELEGNTVYMPQGHIVKKMDGVADVKAGPARIFLSPPHMGGEEMSFVKEAFDSNYVAPLGPMVDAFEREFAEMVGIPYAVAVVSGTAAMHLALRLLGAGPGDEVIASSLTFIGGVTPIVFQGATPVFIDSDRISWNMDPDLLAEELEECRKKGKFPKAVVPTDLYGQCVNYGRIFEICEEYGVPVVADAAESLGATYLTQRRKGAKTRNENNNKNSFHAGVGAKAAVFSFNGNKIITTSGGGMLASDDKEFIDYARNLSQQAREPFPHYEHTEIGYNYRMSNILAAIGRGQLMVLDERVKRKREIFDYYQNVLGDLPGIEFMPEAEWSRSNRWLTVILITPEEFGASPAEVMKALEAENIEARPVWKPMHLQPVFQAEEHGAKSKEHGGKKRHKARMVGGEVAEDLFNRGLCLPSGTAMTEEDLERVVEVILNCRIR